MVRVDLESVGRGGLAEIDLMNFDLFVDGRAAERLEAMGTPSPITPLKSGARQGR